MLQPGPPGPPARTPTPAPSDGARRGPFDLRLVASRTAGNVTVPARASSWGSRPPGAAAAVTVPVVVVAGALGLGPATPGGTVGTGGANRASPTRPDRDPGSESDEPHPMRCWPPRLPVPRWQSRARPAPGGGASLGRVQVRTGMTARHAARAAAAAGSRACHWQRQRPRAGTSDSD